MKKKKLTKWAAKGIDPIDKVNEGLASVLDLNDNDGDDATSISHEEEAKKLASEVDVLKQGLSAVKRAVGVGALAGGTSVAGRSLKEALLAMEDGDKTASEAPWLSKRAAGASRAARFVRRMSKARPSQPGKMVRDVGSAGISVQGVAGNRKEATHPGYDGVDTPDDQGSEKAGSI